MSLNFDNALDMVVTHAFRLGIFDRVNQHELKAVTGNGMTMSYWTQKMRAIPRRSGLDATTICLTMTGRIYQNVNYEPQDEIDPVVVNAASLLLTAYSGDFDLGGTVAEVDLLGAYSDGLGFDAGYVELSGAMCRIVDINLPLVINDAFSQVA